MSQTTHNKRVETRIEIQTFIDRLKYALQEGTVRINFQIDRNVDEGRNKKYTNRYTIGHLFPDEDEVVVLKRELLSLSVKEYLETVIDTRFPKRSEMRVFAKQYSNNYVYIKLRVELVSTHAIGNHFIFVMSFHYSEFDFKDSDFPYKEI